ncbi:tyrosine-type recombinase/integrase [Treponema vincentii]|uniref:Tyrosine-type recombinase/integrase n=1 Tax=Treponema vincentii TaxID=69710 RepID=A0A6P1Y3K0_9SPIR|nr:tyrosine-type recombinase/integrase [Treponema vincentii]
MGEQGRYRIDPSIIQHILHESVLKSGIQKSIGCHTFHHSFATYLPESGYDIRTIQELLGHSDVSIALVYPHVLNRGDLGVQSPIDRMGFIPLACLVKICLISLLLLYSGEC